MFIKKIFFALVILSVAVACNSGGNNGKVKDDAEYYVAIVDSSMTLADVAKANNIGEPFLRTKLGINKRIGSSLDIIRMGKMFDFTIDDLKKIIEDQKNKDLLEKVDKNSNTKKKK